jgi:cytochrome c oxidase subunit II
MSLGVAGFVRAGLAVVWLSALVAMPAHAADAGAGKAAYAVCAACHGPAGEGNVAMNAPKIAGQEAWYLRRQMEAYQQGLRGTAAGDVHGMQMRPMAMTVTAPGALENLIAYIGTLPDVPAPPTITGDAAAGKAAYAVCAACHGPAGQGVEQLGGPQLAGQSDWYLVRQLDNYKKGLRGYDPKDTYGNQMKPMAAVLATDKAVQDVVAYINTLR